MKRVLVVAGGTGSTNLQIGLHAAGIEYELLVNAYDDGKSTGFVRQIARCLGPSDIRKNLHSMLGIKDQRSLYLSTLGCRFNAWSSAEAEGFCRHNCVTNAVIREGLAEWFRIAGEQRYEDVSVMNLALAGLAVARGSMQRAADEVAQSMGLPAAIHLSSDVNVDLYAVSRSGVSASEGEIVTWGRAGDPLERIEFRWDLWQLTPRLELRAAEAITRADAVVIAPGTLFSSILPTLVTKGFREAVKPKQVIVVENLQLDADVAGYEPEQALGMVLDALEGCHIDLIPRSRFPGPHHDPAQLVRHIQECAS